MAVNKIFKIAPAQFRELIPSMGSCLATDKITVEGELIEYMYRENPAFETDSGWRFFSGNEKDLGSVPPLSEVWALLGSLF